MFLTMMNEQLGLGSNSTQAATPQPEAARVQGLRTLILDLLFASPVITAQEWATAVERTSNTQNAETLAKWYRNAVREIATREEAAAPVVFATGQQKQQLIRLLNHPKVTRALKTKVLVKINRLTEAQATTLLVELADLTAPTGGGPRVSAWGELVGFSWAA